MSPRPLAHAAALALTAATVTIATPAAALDCSGGRHFADAQIVVPGHVGTVLRATQFAWDGDRRITHACNLTNGGSDDFTSVWYLYSREIGGDFTGICIMLTNTRGTDYYSCATPAAVQRAADAPRGSQDFRLHFDDFGRGIHTAIRR